MSEPAAQPAASVGPAAAKPKKLLGTIISLVIVLGALVLTVYLLAAGQLYPRTDDAYVQARYISVSSEVPGRIFELPAREGLPVSPGDLLVRINPESYQLAVAEAAAQIVALEAQLAEATRQRAAALEMVQISKENTVRVLAQQELAQSTYERMGPLAEQGYVTRERYDSARSSSEQAGASLLMAKSHELAAELAVPSLDTIAAEINAARIRLAQAELELQRTQVRAPFQGRVVNCDLAPGQMVAPGQSLFSLIDTTEWFVVANFREGDLKNIKVGDTAQVRVLTQPDTVFTGKVDSVGFAVQTQDVFDFGPLPTVRNKLNWVRVAQRFPVRIRIEGTDLPDAFRVGASAVVTIER